MKEKLNIESFESAFAASLSGEVKFRRKALDDFAATHGHSKSLVYGMLKRVRKVSHGVYEFPTFSGTSAPMANPFRLVAEKAKPVKASQVATDIDCYVPDSLETYVKWGHAKDIHTIIKSGMFYPVYITGPSGNGKTIMVEQACAELKRPYVRVQISPETDEDDLIGGFRLVDGATVFAKGPVVKAMEAGAILLIDEIDRGSNKLMALQGVLEGKPIMIKKTGEVIHPAKGFNILATSNTKGRGSIDGRYISASIIDEAFLERFTITLEQEYPNEAVERKIVLRHMEVFGAVDPIFAEKLTTWATAIRTTFNQGGVDEVISTRRLCHIAQTFAIFQNRLKAIELCVSRFEADTKLGFIELYKGIDAAAAPGPAGGPF